jgi:flavin-dependent dehydrogenase
LSQHKAHAFREHGFAMTVSVSCDIVVIGGGPAGSAAATALAKRGYQVVLLEKERHPRYAVGESIIPQFWRYADAIGVSQKILDEGFVQKSGGTVTWNGVTRQFSFRDFGYTRPALHVERDRFDAILFEHARSEGVEAHENITVTEGDLADGGRPVVHYRDANKAPGSVACRYVIDASGQGAVIARQLGVRVVDDAFRFMSVWGYFDNSRFVSSDAKAHPFEALGRVKPTTFVSSIPDTGPWGWAWHIPLRTTTSVGLVVPRDQLRGGDVEGYFRRVCERVPYFDLLLQDARFVPGSVRALRDYSYRPSRLVGPGFFLAGDAASFIDPIFSVGIVLAMYSAYLAAWAIDGALRNPASAERNQGVYADQLRSRIEVSRTLALPRFRDDVGAEDDRDRAKNMIGFESLDEQELFYVVSTLTTRSDNLDALGVSVRSSERFHILPEITLA